MTDNYRQRLTIPARLQREIETSALAGYPDESCGILVGRFNCAETTVELVTTARNLNTERSRDRFVLDPDDFVRADRIAADNGLDVVGVWHSHPDHPAEPSQTDLGNAWPCYSYVIVSVSRERVEAVRSWRLDGDRFEEERLDQ
jgi:proteasome lid subunit RPN8/RPN11